MDNRDKIIQGLEKSFQKLIEYKKHKKSPLITMRNGEIIEIAPDEIVPAKYLHKIL